MKFLEIPLVKILTLFLLLFGKVWAEDKSTEDMIAFESLSNNVKAFVLDDDRVDAVNLLKTLQTTIRDYDFSKISKAQLTNIGSMFDIVFKSNNDPIMLAGADLAYILSLELSLAANKLVHPKEVLMFVETLNGKAKELLGDIPISQSKLIDSTDSLVSKLLED